MTWWAWCLIGIIVAGFVATVWLKRAGEKEWGRYQNVLMWQQLYEAIRQAEWSAAVFVERWGEWSQKLMAAITDVALINYNEVAVPPHLEGNRIAGAWIDEHHDMPEVEVTVLRTCWCGSPAGFRADKGFIDCLADRMHDWRGPGREGSP